MSKINQSGAIVILASIIIIAYYIFAQYGMVSQSQLAQYKCLKGLASKPNLCIYCLQKNQKIARQSSLFITDSVSKFKVAKIPIENVLSCQQLLQFVPYQQFPIQNVQDIKFQQMNQIQKIIKLLKIQMTSQPVSVYQVDKQIEQIAIFQLKQKPNQSNTVITYASSGAERLGRYFGKILSQSSATLSLFFIIFLWCQKGEFKIGFVNALFISLLVYAQTVLSGQDYLIYLIDSLLIGYYFSKSLISRSLTVLVLFSSLFASIYFEQYLTEYLISILLVYLVAGRNTIFSTVGLLGGFCFVALIFCLGFKQHHHWLSLPLRNVIHYTIITISPLLMEFLLNINLDVSYDKLPSSSSSATTENGVSLPGFEQEEQDSQDQPQN